MSVQAITWALEQTVGSPTGKVILLCLANYADKRGACFPGHEVIAKECEVSRRSVVDWMQRLEAAGLLTRNRRFRGDGSRTSDSIILSLPDTIDTTSGDQGAKSAPSGDQVQMRASPSANDDVTRCSTFTARTVSEPSEEPSSLRSDSARELEHEFNEVFWPAYPRKVAKRAALKAYIPARKRASLETIMAGVRRYASERAGMDPTLTKHAQGWLSGDRWLDEPTPKFQGQSPPSDRERMNSALDRFIQGKSDEPAHDTIDGSFERTDRRGPENPVQLPAAATRNR